MVLQLVKGLTKGEYDTMATMIQQSKPLPIFSKARSSLQMEERRRENQDDQLDTALISSPMESSGSGQQPQAHPHQPSRGRGGNRGGRIGRGRGNGRNGKGKGCGGGE